jgi:hypothetical protein
MGALSFQCCKTSSFLTRNADMHLETNDQNDSHNKTLRNTHTKKNVENNKMNTEVNENNSRIKDSNFFYRNISNLYSSNGFIWNGNRLNRESLEDYINNERDYIDRIQTLNSVLYQSPRLILNIYRSSEPNKLKNVLKISAQGLEISRRSKFDGYTYFGIGDDDLMNDYLLPMEQEEIENNRDKKRLFLINFDLDTNKFYIRDLFSGLMSFFRVKNETVLRHNSLINVGDSYLLISLGGAEDEDADSHYQSEKNNMINIKVFNNNGQFIHDPM